MKALIFNSGLGKRMGLLTKNNPKCLVKLYNEESILERQLRLLQACGLKQIIITTGPFAEQIETLTKKKEFSSLDFTLVNNPLYDQTNYIYSMYLASQYIDDDMIILHGDLVFDQRLLASVLQSKDASTITVDVAAPLPEKDFKGCIVNGNINEISVSIFDKNCVTLQPMYKLSKIDAMLWVNKVKEFVAAGNVSVYADNALNTILPTMNVKPFDCSNKYYIQEIDNLTDLERVSKGIQEFDNIIDKEEKE